MADLRWLRLACAATGLACAVGAYTLLATTITVDIPEPVRLSIKAMPKKAVAQSLAPTETLPLLQIPKAPVKKTVPPKPAPVVEPEPVKDVPLAKDDAPLLPPEPESIVKSAPPLDFQQPAIAPSRPASDAMPPPPKPPEDAFVSQYNDAPGGRVVVLAMLVNDRGEVVDAKLVVPSKYALQDIALMVASRQQIITALQPPLAPGEVRWLEVRLEYPELSSHEGLVP